MHLIFIILAKNLFYYNSRDSLNEILGNGIYVAFILQIISYEDNKGRFLIKEKYDK